ncbi:MAG: hypothetical protein FWF20_00730 [Betaproteobacteria bacterium]|nr:hypothetical protein [Betaproteobacteria bacterium]MCL2885304.1 hypothetical protein [Betaproteobacteria bacterium]
MRRHIVFAVILVVSGVTFFVSGVWAGRKLAIGWFADESQIAFAQVELGHYTVYRDIALDIIAGRTKRAKCNADLLASSMFDSLKDCMLEEVCKARLQQSIVRSAPEVLGEIPVPFDYIPMVDGRGNCK